MDLQRWLCGQDSGCRVSGLGWWLCAEAVVSEVMRPWLYVVGLSCGIISVASLCARRVAGSPPCAFPFSIFSVSGFGCTNLLYSLFFSLLLYQLSMIPWLIDHFVIILPADKIEKAPDLFLKTCLIISYLRKRP
jgi:hypothetical protein